ncbi:hypothetical protein CW304_32785 [Bacillus sp. UFRGS-B20]|nr:hypothetical protein CW304_32785 [Bacillus sp. UFRGS-B20]
MLNASTFGSLYVLFNNQKPNLIALLSNKPCTFVLVICTAISLHFESTMFFNPNNEKSWLKHAGPQSSTIMLPLYINFFKHTFPTSF